MFFSLLITSLSNRGIHGRYILEQNNILVFFYMLKFYQLPDVKCAVIKDD